MAPKGIELASAYVSLSLNTDGVGRDLQRFVRGIKDIEVDVDANVRPASTGVGKWRSDEERKEVNIDVDADAKGAKANVARWRATEEARPVNIRVNADTRKAQRDVDALSSNLFKFGRSDVLKLNIGAAAITSLPALASGLAEVAAGIQQVAQAGLALPGIMAGATSSIGTLVFGLSGVGDAYDAMNKAADDAAKSGGDVAAQQRAQMSASFGLRNAIVDEADARKDVNRAIRDTHRDLQDLNLEMRGGVLSEKRAVLELDKARKRLASGDYTDYREALLDVQEAELRVDESRSRNQRTAAELNEANAKGVMGSDQVVAANERLIRSQQGVAQAEAAVAAAVPAASAAQENAALAMSKLAPEAQDFVNALMDVSGPVQTLRNLVQGNIFRGMDDQLRNLAVKSMPMLEQGLGGLGDAWNNTFREIFRVAGEDETQGILSRIFGNTEEAQNILTDAIDPLTQGLGVLSEAGSRALPRLADGFVAVADRFANFITQADESGKLDEWIGESITALGHLGETALNVGKMFTGITNAADGSFLENLERWTNDWQTWLNSAQGQNTLRDIFAEGKQVFEQWKPILEDLPGLFKGIYDGASQWIGAVTTVVAPVTEFLKQHPDLVATAANAYMAFKSAQVLGSLATLGGALDDLSGKFGTPGKSGKGLLGKLSMFAAGAVLLQEVSDAGNWARLFEDVFGESPFGQRDTTFGAKGAPGVPYGNVQGPGAKQAPLGPGAAIPPGMPSVAPGQNPLRAFSGTPKPGQSGRDFAHSTMMPYWQSQGLTVGDHAADQYGEHQNGAVDIMVPNISEGQRVLQEVLADPNVYGAIFDNKVYGYGQGMAPRPYSAGNTGNPTQDHQDHVHVWYKPGNKNNIRPPQPPMPAGPKPPVLGPPVPKGPSVAAAPSNPTLDQLLFPGVKTYDQGGPWPPGTLGINTTGQHEFVLNPEDIEYLKSQGIDPSSLQHGSTGGALPGPTDQPLPGNRTGGYIPATAGNTNPVGQGGLSSILGLGESFVNNLIDTGAQAASMAATAAAGAASFGAGAAAGPAASTAISMGAEALKRGVSWGFDMASIWGEALPEILMPFGVPRWLGQLDPMAFVPQIPGQQPGQQPGGGAAAQAIQGWAQPGNPAMANGTAQQGAGAALAQAKTQPSYGQPPTQPSTQPPPVDPMNPASWLNFGGIFDNGGVLPPKSIGMNMAKTPEYIFTQKQMAGMARNAANANSGGRGDTNNFYATDVDSTLRQWEHTKRRQARRHNGRP